MRTWITIFLLVALSFTAVTALAANQRVTLTGKVVDPNGKPLGHVTVLVYQAGIKSGYSTYCPTCYADCGKRAITDADGFYKIESLSRDLRFTLLAVRDGYFSELVRSVDPATGPPPTAVLKARQPVNDPQRVIRGKVVDSRGRPLRDAIVQPKGILLNDEKHGRISMSGTIAGLDLIAVTSDKGEFEISYDRPALRVLILVEARGFAPKLFNQLPTGLDRQTLTVTDGATLRGRLVDNGKPVNDALMGLVARKRGLGAELKLYGDPYDEMRIGTKPDGTFAFTNVPVPVEWYVYGKMESIAGRGATGPMERVTKKDGEDVNVGDIQIKPGYRLQGKVVLSDGKSIADGMRVSISADRAFDTQTVPLRTDGSFEFFGLAPEKYQVFASVEGYQAPPWDYRMKTDPPGTVQIEKEINDFLLTLDPVK